MILLRCPKFLRCLTADAKNFDRIHSLASFILPLAALGSFPTATVRNGRALQGARWLTKRRGEGTPPCILFVRGM